MIGGGVFRSTRAFVAVIFQRFTHSHALNKKVYIQLVCTWGCAMHQDTHKVCH